MAFVINDNCTGCGACSRMCPVSAISGVPKEVFVINDKRCVNCGVCGRVCPKGVILDQNGEPTQMVPRRNWPLPRIKTEECTACSMCIDICGRQALKISDPRFKGDIRVYAILSEPKKCVGCAMCADECPMQAIVMEVDA